MLADESEFIEDDVGGMSATTSWKRPRLENGVDEDLSSVAGLRQKASKLVQELSAEKAKVKELKKLNQTLQKSEYLEQLPGTLFRSPRGLCSRGFKKSCKNVRENHI